MEQPLVSVVIPCYQLEARQQLLLEALRSIDAQTYPKIEVVLVDDGSSDRTSQILEELPLHFSSTRLACRSERLAENSGPSIARNHGVRLAKGPLIAFLDFDDLWLPSYLHDVVDCFNSSSERQVVLTSTIFYRELLGFRKADTSKFPTGLNEMPFAEYCTYFLANNFPVAMGSAVVCKAELFELYPKAYFDEHLSKLTAEDVCFGYRLLEQNVRPFFLDTPLVVHRTYYSMASRSLSAYLNKNELGVYEYIYSQTMGPLFERIRPELSEQNCVRIEENINRVRSEFKLKSLFLEKERSQIIQIILRKPSTFKTWLRLMLLKLSRYFPLSILRNVYFFSHTASEESAVGEVEELIKAVSAR